MHPTVSKYQPCNVLELLELRGHASERLSTIDRLLIPMSSEVNVRESVAPYFCIVASIVADLRGTKVEPGGFKPGATVKDPDLLAVQQFRTPLTTAKSFDEPQSKHGAQPLLSKAYSEKGKSTGAVGGPKLREDDLRAASDFWAHPVPASPRPRKARPSRFSFGSQAPHSNPPTQLFHRDCSGLADLPLTHCVHSRRPGSAANEHFCPPFPGRI